MARTHDTAEVLAALALIRREALAENDVRLALAATFLKIEIGLGVEMPEIPTVVHWCPAKTSNGVRANLIVLPAAIEALRRKGFLAVDENDLEHSRATSCGRFAGCGRKTRTAGSYSGPSAARRSRRPALPSWSSVLARLPASRSRRTRTCFGTVAGSSWRTTAKDTRSIQDYLGHVNIQHTVKYTALAPTRFKDFWRWYKKGACRTFGSPYVRRRVDHSTQGHVWSGLV
jgi:hypothetical protein